MLQFLNIEGSLFTFLFWSLCPIVHPSNHPDERNVVDSLSFVVLLVRACSPTSPECPSMFLPLSSSSFIVFCPKGSCFRLSNVSLWPTCLVLHVPALLLCDLYFKKPPLYPPLLSQLSAWCLDHWFRCCPCLHFATLVVFRCHLFNWCILFVFYLPVIVICVHASIKLPLYTPPLLPPKTGCFSAWCLRFSTSHFAFSNFLRTLILQS